MPLHLIKLCVGCDSIEDLASWQAERLKARRRAGEKKPQLFHRTFQTPKRRAELLDGGSLYWVIKGLVQVRQPLFDIAEGTKDDGTPCCLLMLKNALVPVRPDAAARVPGLALSGPRRGAAGSERTLRRQHRRHAAQAQEAAGRAGPALSPRPHR